MGCSTVVVNPLVSRVNFDTVKDFAPIAHTSTVPLVLVVHPSLAARSVNELIALARASSSPPAFASSGAGTISHLALERIEPLVEAYDRRLGRGGLIGEACCVRRPAARNACATP